jgi:hypothetical protein
MCQACKDKTDDSDPILSAAQTAKLIHMSLKQFHRRLREKKDTPAYDRPGKNYQFRLSNVLAYIEAHRGGGSPSGA